MDSLKERLAGIAPTVSAAMRKVYGLPVAAVPSDTHGGKMALWCDNGMAGVGQVCVAVNVGEFPDQQLQAIAALANVGITAGVVSAEALARIEDLEAELAEKEAAMVALRDDLLMRAEAQRHMNGGELVVEASNGVWIRFNDAIGKTEHPNG